MKRLKLQNLLVMVALLLSFMPVAVVAIPAEPLAEPTPTGGGATTFIDDSTVNNRADQAVAEKTVAAKCLPEDPRCVFVPIVLKSYSCSGDLGGNVVDATTGNPLPNVHVTVAGTALSDVTDAGGSYSILDVPSGPRSITAARDGYVTVSQNVDVGCDRNYVLNFALSSDLPPTQMRIVLTWGESPRDLDSHLWLPPDTPCHIYWFNPGSSCTFSANLDRDDNSSYGPETITIAGWYPGTYTYAVYNWSNEADLIASGARVEVYQGSTLAAAYAVPTSGSGRWWHVFDIDGTTRTLTTRNYLTPDSPGPYDPGPGGRCRE